MLKKLMLASLTTIATSLAAQSAYADFYYCNQNQIQNPWYLDLGASAYYLQTPEFGVGTANYNTSNPLYKSNDNELWTWMPSAALGYQFNNRFLTQIFGDHASVELDGSYFNTGKQKSTSNDASRMGVLWRINGTGPVGNGVVTNLPNLLITSQVIYSNFGLYFTGNKTTSNPFITTSPFVGIVYTHVDQKYNYGATWLVNPGDFDSSTQDNFQEKINTDYYGISIGDQINYDLFTNLSVFARAELQLLNANSNLNGQEATAIWTTSSATDSNSKLTYRGILTVGTTYTFANFLTGPSVSLNGGYDRWGYTPEIVNPRGNNTRPAHLTGDTSNNFFATISMHIPFG